MERRADFSVPRCFITLDQLCLLLVAPRFISHFTVLEGFLFEAKNPWVQKRKRESI